MLLAANHLCDFFLWRNFINPFFLGVFVYVNALSQKKEKEGCSVYGSCNYGGMSDPKQLLYRTGSNGMRVGGEVGK